MIRYLGIVGLLHLLVGGRTLSFINSSSTYALSFWFGLFAAVGAQPVTDLVDLVGLLKHLQHRFLALVHLIIINKVKIVSINCNGILEDFPMRNRSCT